jgi:hypothetical protein
MKRLVKRLSGIAMAGIAALSTFASAAANTAAATTHVKWDAQAIISMTLTPNYFTGFGQVKAVFGAQPPTTHGPNAGPGVGQGDIDFGNVLSATNYLYKYAAHVNVVSNDSNGFMLYGEGAADFNQNGGAGTTPVSSTLFYVNSTSGAPADPNNGFSPGFPFQKTAGIVTGGTYAGPTSINYGGVYPGAAVATSATATGDFYYDYLLKVPASITTNGDYYVWIVYTVVGS